LTSGVSESSNSSSQEIEHTNEMLKLLLIHALPAVLVIQCGTNNRRASQAPPQRSEDIQQSTEKKACDFSKFKPMKAQANHGSPVISMPQPAYPPELKANGVQGKVEVLLLVNVRSGLVEQVCLMDGDERLAESAKEAGLRVKFAPYSKYIQDKYTHAEEIAIYNFVSH